MQFKDAMLFQAKIYYNQNKQLLELLATVDDAMLTKEYPALADGTIIKTLDDMITNAAFTMYNVKLSCIDKDAHAAQYIAELRNGPMGIFPVAKSYADQPFSVIAEVLMALSQKYIDIYTACDETELTTADGLAPYDFASKGFCIAYQLRGEIYAVLRENGLFKEEHPFGGPLA